MPGAEFYSDLLVYTRLITLGFITYVLGVGSFAMFVLPRWQGTGAAQTKEAEAARAVKPTPVTALPTAA
ncbi:MAG: hypothetical protein HYY11_02080 [Candidatus Methylomirabilis oxyfera]|nr:hypothetical protein [Candidatus Methylomirabilis oxyfera]